MTEPDLTRSGNYLLGQIDAKMTHMIASFSEYKADIKGDHDAIATRLNTHALRIERIERSHWKTAGIVSLIPIFFTIVGLLMAYFI